MKKNSLFGIVIALLVVLALVFTIIMFTKKDSKSNEFNETAKELAQNHFNFERIFQHSVLPYDKETGLVTDTTYSSYAEFEKAIRETYASEYADELLTGEGAVYYNKDGNLYVNIDNASHTGFYTGNGGIVITIKDETKTKVEFEAKITAYTDDKKQDSTEVVYTMVAEKQGDNIWKLKEVKK